MKDAETLNKIESLIFWYEKNSSKATINELLDFQDKLATYSYFHAELVAKYKKEYNMSYFARKIEFNKAKNEFMKSGKSATASESLSEEKIETYRKIELENEYVGYRLDTLLKQVNKILQVVNQRISYLKFEIQQTKIHT